MKCKLSIKWLSFSWASSRNRMSCVKTIASYDSATQFVTFKNRYFRISPLPLRFSLRNITVVERNCELNKTVWAKTPLSISKLFVVTGCADITPLMHDIWQSRRCKIVLENVLVSTEIFSPRTTYEKSL